ncbi:MAG: hypothetical protein EBU90_01845 [Proteobacteria bacterium]|nr:hypothetical protein [Pseudomonadota bacterium]NBP13223.1 hypothetical protein [bacterium]
MTLRNLNLQILKYNEDLQKMKDYYLTVNQSQALLLDMSEMRRVISRLKKKLAQALIEERKRAELAIEAQKQAFFAKYASR